MGDAKAPEIAKPKPRQKPAVLPAPSAAADDFASPFAWSAGAGNAVLGRLVRHGALFPQLIVSNPGDPQEREADRFADTFMASSAARAWAAGRPRGTVHRSCSACSPDHPCEECAEHDRLVRRRRDDGGGPIDRDAAAVVRRLGAGRPLDGPLRATFEPRLGRNLGHVRVHTSADAAEAARSLNARAFTIGSDVAFASGRWAPDTSDGARLLAHELAHVRQQADDRSVVDRDSAIVHRQQASAPIATPSTDDQDDAEGDGSQAGGTADDRLNQIVKAPDPKGDLVQHGQTHVTFTDDLDYVRYQLQVYIAEHGADSIDRFLTGTYTMGTGVGIVLVPPQPSTKSPDEQAKYRKHVVETVRNEAKSLKLRAHDFLKDFERRGADTTNRILDESKARIEKQRNRYGLKELTKSFMGITYSTTAKMDENDQTDDLRSSAQALLTKHQAVAAAKKALDAIPSLGGASPPGGQRDPAEAAKETAARETLAKATRDYALQRQLEETHHPILAAYQLEAFAPDTDGVLTTLATGTKEAKAATLMKEVNLRLENIEKVRKKVDGEWATIWTLPSIVAATRELPDIKNYKSNPELMPGLRKELVDDEASTLKADAEFKAMALGVLLVALAVITAIPTGGLSAGAAAFVYAATIAESALLAYSGYAAFQKYDFEAAAAGTDFDKARAISQEEPSLFWLALDIVGVVTGLPKALSAFRSLLRLRRAVVVAQAAGKFEEAKGLLAKLEAEGNAVSPERRIGEYLREEADALAKDTADSFKEIEANADKLAPSAVAGFEEEIAIGGSKTWRRAEDVWCLFASPPKKCVRIVWRLIGRRQGPWLELQSMLSGKTIKYVGSRAFIEEADIDGVMFDSISRDVRGRVTAVPRLQEVKGDYSVPIKLGSKDVADRLIDEASRQMKVAKRYGLVLEWHVRRDQLAGFRNVVGTAYPGIVFVPYKP